MSKKTCRSNHQPAGQWIRPDKPLARFCGPEARAHIRRNTRRSLRRYLVLAKALIAGEVGFEEVLA